MQWIQTAMLHTGMSVCRNQITFHLIAKSIYRSPIHVDFMVTQPIRKLFERYKMFQVFEGAALCTEKTEAGEKLCTSSI